MEQLTRLLFEAPGPAVVGLLIVGLVLAYLAWRGRGVQRLLPLLPLVAAGLLLLADALVETDREKIESLLRGVGESALANRADDIGAAMTEDFQIEAVGRPQITGRRAATLFVRSLLKFYPLKSLEVRRLDIRVDSGERGSAEVSFRAEAASGRMAADRSLTKWRFDLRKGPAGRWLMEKADLRELNGRSAASLTLTPELQGWF